MVEILDTKRWEKINWNAKWIGIIWIWWSLRILAGMSERRKAFRRNWFGRDLEWCTNRMVIAYLQWHCQRFIPDSLLWGSHNSHQENLNHHSESAFSETISPSFSGEVLVHFMRVILDLLELWSYYKKSHRVIECVKELILWISKPWDYASEMVTVAMIRL